MKLAFCLLLTLAFFSFASAGDNDSEISPSHYFFGFAGESATIFGSTDQRVGAGLSYAYGKPEKRFHIGKVGAQLVYELYGDYTESSATAPGARNATFAAGTLAYARWRWPVYQTGMGIYVDLGWGVQAADRTTVDLESIFNSTPVLDVGTSFRGGHNEYLVGVRYLHISNAGLVLPNYGQNEFYVTVGVRY